MATGVAIFFNTARESDIFEIPCPEAARKFMPPCLIVKPLMIGEDHTNSVKIGSWPKLIDLMQLQTSSTTGNQAKKLNFEY